MPKIIVFLLLISNIAWSQDVKKKVGLVKDAETQEPIAFVNIFIEGSTDYNLTGGISNELGEFAIDSRNSEVTFSHIGYESLTVELNDEFNEISLTPKNYVLDEVVVSTVSAEDYLKDVIKSSNSKIDKNTLLKSYCREVVKVNDAYTKFSDALVNYYIKKGNGKAMVTLDQHRALKSDRIDEEDSNNIDNINSAFTLQDYVKDAYNFKGLKNLLKDKNYEFVRRIRQEANGEEYEYIDISPKKDVEELLLKGYVIIDPKTSSILEFKIYTSADHLKYSELKNILIAKFKINGLPLWSKFNVIDDKYILSYNKKTIGMYIKMGKKIDDDFEFSSDLFVYQFNENIEMPEEGYERRTIYESGTEFHENFWENYNSFPLSEDELNFINSVAK
ncbi:carboxypeptidase-like regulatory domain-containing protein [Mangrovimonas sp. YM274]|uniref:carboxypeptidase-like regulatory domain-containing protein n=1 Tax=Mangrovimonas sp. YM274 TaxID=3070660 RepID=UPI0027DE02CE|nr:carboxypeptidase-like regulatory domain-containing protein [Mangrovimonas sp. YM274]WMI67188.1 carboxypeptidase-like regulatory domain-containing protein [Mangrovimonas sp. YM274]